MAKKKEKAIAPSTATKKIRMNVSIAGLYFSYYPGQELTVGVDIEAGLAETWIEVGHASPVGGDSVEPGTDASDGNGPAEPPAAGITPESADAAGGGAGDAGSGENPPQA